MAIDPDEAAGEEAAAAPSSQAVLSSAPEPSPGPASPGEHRLGIDEFNRQVYRGACVNEASSKAYASAAEYYESLNTKLGIPMVILTAATSASLLAAIGDTWPKAAKIATAVLSTFATALAAVITFLKPSEKAKTFEKASREYLSIAGEQMGLLYEVQLLPESDQRVTKQLADRFTESDRRRRAVEAVAPMLMGRRREKCDALLMEGLKKAELGPGFVLTTAHAGSVEQRSPKRKRTRRTTTG
jgi:hypothetical protein